MESRIFGSTGKIGVLDNMFQNKSRENYTSLLDHEGGKFVFVQKGMSGNYDVRVTYYIVSPLQSQAEYSILDLCKNLKINISQWQHQYQTS
jgi:hypothetical protein